LIISIYNWRWWKKLWMQYNNSNIKDYIGWIGHNSKVLVKKVLLWWRMWWRRGARSGERQDWWLESRGVRWEIGEWCINQILDQWLGRCGATLREIFPRLYKMSTQQTQYMKEVGTWVAGQWSWQLKWRRDFFVWKQRIVSDLMEMLEPAELTHD
jgi:hypothetical protein